MIRLFGILLCMFTATSLAAQSLPSLYDVTGVASADMLNVREGPSADNDIIETLTHDRKDIEVLRVQNDWGLIGMGEYNGWVSMNFLAPVPITDGAARPPLTCVGTEPFWDLTIDAYGANFATPETANRSMIVISENTGSNGLSMALFEDLSMTHMLVVKAGYCSDGMSDREFGMSAFFYTQSPRGDYAFQGCCTFQ